MAASVRHTLEPQVCRAFGLARLQVGCAERLYGDLRAADVVKLHARSPKITAQNFDDFAGRRVPALLERVKIDLRRGEFEVFGYGTEQYPAQPLWLKAQLLAPDDPDYVAQKAFDDRLLALGRQSLSSAVRTLRPTSPAGRLPKTCWRRPKRSTQNDDRNGSFSPRRTGRTRCGCRLV